MIDKKLFAGILNIDSPNETIPSGHHKDAMNIVFKGEKGGYRAEGMPSTTLVANSYLPVGVNETIGVKYDPIRNKIYIFNHNSNSNHGIYVYNTRTASFSTLLQSNTNTDGDILNFDLKVPITDIDIYHGSDGDILFFIDSLYRPTKINVGRTYSTTKRSFINVAKIIPKTPIRCVYEHDDNVMNNNLRNGLFQFIYRWVYDDNEKTFWSTASNTPLPNQPYNQLTATDFKLNSRISLFVPTGDADVKKVEVAYRYSKDGITSDYFLIDSFDKTSLSISDNDIYRVKFYNSGNSVPVDMAEQKELMSYVPKKAKAQTLLNGNVLGYANILEGFDKVNGDMSVDMVEYNTEPYIFDANGTLLVASINGEGSGSKGVQVKIQLYGTGTNSGSNDVSTLDNGKGVYIVDLINNSGTAIGASYSSSASNPTVLFVLTSIKNTLVANGFTEVSLAGNTLIVSYPTAVTLRSYGIKTNDAAYTGNITSTRLTQAYQSAYGVGVVYYDAEGRTNGAVVSTGSFYDTKYQGVVISHCPVLNIKHRPPLWASHYQVVRTKSLTYEKRLQWVSSGAYCDDAANASGIRYAYIQVDNINLYNENISSNVLGYSFAEGDRVRMTWRYNADGSYAGLTNIRDYEIVGVADSVTTGGLKKTGIFIKIIYPTSDIDATLKFDGTADYLNYSLLIYSYKKTDSKESAIFYEFGKQLGIGNAGTSNAYHYGEKQHQDPSNISSTPAKVYVNGGDYFTRRREVPIGKSMYGTGGSYSNGWRFLRVAITASETIDNSVYKLQSTSSNVVHTLGPTDYADASAFFINKSSNQLRVRIRATVPINVTSLCTTKFLCTINKSSSYYAEYIHPTLVLNSGQSYNIDIDYTINVPPLSKLHFLIENTDEVVNQNISSISFRADVLSVIGIDVVEEGFSDFFKSSLTGDGRGLVYDVDAKELNNEVLFRFSQPYQMGTNINGMNLFYPLNYDEFSKEYGEVVALRSRDKNMRVFQYRKVGSVGIYQKFIKNNSGSSELVVSDSIITPNNIFYYTGDYGPANQKGSICSNGYQDYFVDPIKGEFLRLSNDGITSISDAFHVRGISSKANKYLDNTNRAGGYAKILSIFHDEEDKNGELIITMQGADDDVIAADTISFDEKENAFTSRYGFYPDAFVSAENTIVSFKSGQLYLHNGSSYNMFYGVQKDCYITLVSNQRISLKKTFDFIEIDGAGEFNVPIITTSLGQSSSLIAEDFEEHEGIKSSSFLCDVNSLGGLIEGDYLKGDWIQVKLSQKTPNNFVYLTSVNIGFSESNLNR